MDRKIRVLVIDDHEMVRMGLTTFLSLEPDMEVVGEGSNGKDGVELACKLNPDVVLMDLVMDEMDGIAATKELKKKCPNVKVIVLTSFIEQDKVFSVIEAGAFSYLLKTSRAEEITTAIRQAVIGIPTIDSKVTGMMINRMQKEPPKHEHLTPRELEVLSLIGKGMSNKEIGETLFIGIKTVKTHVSNILAKLELDDRTQAAIYANKHGLS
ncbi:DNA-binding response regulator [Vulcanibacillus modesticaldus]|uniref:DNA-binding response regulator n=1 Tax=Vulcanibacillus modesticaldus TaxID=337097 RepID=A0A1D2YWF5_9BACI|nr:response regulator transcription factor [Vulcanibacillus modesticaldus]OEG00032.1 DNA-binding response regulator [Vulcanibacillus modesticaldus]